MAGHSDTDSKVAARTAEARALLSASQAAQARNTAWAAYQLASAALRRNNKHAAADHLDAIVAGTIAATAAGALDHKVPSGWHRTPLTLTALFDNPQAAAGPLGRNQEEA